jgi:hypothetical protein
MIAGVTCPYIKTVRHASGIAIQNLTGQGREKNIKEIKSNRSKY